MGEGKKKKKLEGEKKFWGIKTYLPMDDELAERESER